MFPNRGAVVTSTNITTAESNGSIGTVASGAFSSNGCVLYLINWSNGDSGYSVTDYLVDLTAQNQARLAAPSVTIVGSSIISWSQVPGNLGYRIVVSSSVTDLTSDPTQTGNLHPADGLNITVAPNTTTLPLLTWTPSTHYFVSVHALGSSLAQSGWWSSQGDFVSQAIGPSFIGPPSPRSPTLWVWHNWCSIGTTLVSR
jgi:hypothetical protein